MTTTTTTASETCQAFALCDKPATHTVQMWLPNATTGNPALYEIPACDGCYERFM